MTPTNKHPDFFFNVGFGLISLLAILDLITAVSFSFHIPISRFHFPIAAAILLLSGWIYIRQEYPLKKVKVYLKTMIFVFAIVLVSILIADNFYDLSFDGQTYHQEGVYQLVHFQWNPFYKVLPDKVNLSLFVNHYPKQAETSAAAVYSMTGRIETGKSLNLILLVTSFCMIFSYLKSFTQLSDSLALILSVFFALNPIVIHQALTYMVDGQLGSVLLCMLVCCLLLYDQSNLPRLFLLAFLIVICINIKFTAAVYTAIFIGLTLILFFITKRFQQFKDFFFVACLSTLFAVLLVGFNPYLTNFVQNGNVFYPILGKHSIDIIALNSPPGFSQMNRFERFGISTFAHTDNIDSRQGGRMPILKIPFSLNRQEIKSLSDPDIRIAGFGPLFSGIISLTICLLIFSIWYKSGVLFNDPLAWFILILILSIAVCPEAWWARFIPQFWFVPLIVIILVSSINNRLVIALRNLTCFAIGLNITFSLYMVLQTNILKTAEINYQMAQFRALDAPLNVNFMGFDANRIRFAESGVRFVKQNAFHGLVIPVVYSKAVVLVDSPLPVLPVPWLIMLEERIKGEVKSQR